jgi:hypothetical protein
MAVLATYIADLIEVNGDDLRRDPLPQSCIEPLPLLCLDSLWVKSQNYNDRDVIAKRSVFHSTH